MYDESNVQRVNGTNWDGLCFPANKRKDKIMIVFSGSEGGIGHAARMAEYLQNHGIPAFALGYFKTEHTGKNLDRIPLEIIGEVIEWLLKKGYEKIGIEGISKGAEYAMAAAIRYPRISCVIVKTPSWYYSEGLSKGQPSGSSCWTYQACQLPFTPYKSRKINILKMLLKAKDFNILPVNTGKKVLPESIIALEQIKAPILFFSTKKDTVWPSEESCIRMCERLEQSHFAYPYKHVSFEQMSHMMLEYCGKSIKFFIRSERKEPEICRREREEMGKACVDWIERVWV